MRSDKLFPGSKFRHEAWRKNRENGVVKMMSNECDRSQELRVVERSSRRSEVSASEAISTVAEQNANGERVLIDLSALGVTMKKVRSLIW